jgi:dGTPase
MNIQETEKITLAPYGMRSAESAGRKHAGDDPEQEYRSPYQRDRDRIIHASAFRRLEYKTQVFVNHEGDDYRTRLTHSIEVAQIARTIARALHLNEDLTEALALAHDLGHTPFGHAGEEILNKLMKDHGGFEHNRHTLRIVEELENRYPNFPGLNLTWETREGIVKHTTDFDKTHKIPAEYKPDERPTLEAQIVDIADEIAYDNHDIDDGLMSGLIAEGALETVPLWQEAHAQVAGRFAGITGPVLRAQVIRRLIAQLVDDAIHESRRRLETHDIRCVDDAHRHPTRLIDFSDDLKKRRKPLREFLTRELYHHPRVNRMSDKARRFIAMLFQAYIENPSMLPREHQGRIHDPAQTHTVVCDYIAGMTDRYCLNEHKKLFDPYEKV